MILNEMISALRIELQDTTPASYIWDEDDLIRAIKKSVSLMSRLLPQRAIVETTLVRTITDEALTITDNTGTLTYKPIKVGSVDITDKTLDTDYRVNYLTGVITEIGSNLTDSPPNYTVSYVLDPHMLDISSLLPDYIKIERYEYPAGDAPPTLITGDVFGDFVVFRGDITLSEDRHLRIIYLGRWTPPTPSAEGSYPVHLDSAVVIGSAGQALIFKAEYYVQEAASALSDLTAPTLHVFTNPSAPNLPSAPTAPDAPSLSFSDTETALGAVASEITAAKAHHTTGAALINVGTRGEDCGKIYGEYAAALVRAAEARATEAVMRARIQEDAVALYASEVASYGSDVNQYANEVSGTIGKYREQIQGEGTAVAANNAMIAKFVAQANEQEMKARKFLEIAGRYLASGQAKINEFLVSLGLKAEFPTSKAATEQRD